MSLTTGIQTVADFYIRMAYYLTVLGGVTALGLYDMKKRRVPNWALAILLPIALLSIVLPPMPQPLWPELLRAVSGFFMGGLLLLAVAMATKGGVGGGDVKLCALLGIIAGPHGILMTLLIAAVLAMAAGGIFRLVTKEKLLSIPFVPFLAVGFSFIGFQVMSLF